ncbi:hypothetical protein Sango_1057700 [Sesamum angolense]|uniref:LysM domain-containing protein n=1 Tax=Sesamum angolense TaxID=2727404 RepID=A0AAE1X0U5_9LAMI|nr:hypothetical protein Sango_1057700 [Sesamum angolense]
MEKDRRMIDYYGDMDLLSRGMVGSSLLSRSEPISLPSSATSIGTGLNGGVNYIVHTVSKFDTLAGIAIKYGVEVADIKRLNGLVTDLQMFALRTLQIPLPGRHPPSSLCNGHDSPQRPNSSEQTPSNHRHSELFDSFQSLKLKSSTQHQVCKAMSSLQGYYSLNQLDQKASLQGSEMTVFRNGMGHYLEGGPFSTSSSLSNPPLSRHRKSKSLANGLMLANGGVLDPFLSQEDETSGADNLIEKLLRRRQKSEDFTGHPIEKLLKEDNSNSSAISSITSKGLALRPKSATRTASGVRGELGRLYPIPIGLGDSFLTDTVNGVRKSPSTSNLPESDSGASSSIWAI